MDKAREIVYMLSKYKMGRIDVLGNEESDTRFTKLYNLIKDGEVMNDEDAARLIYGTTPADPNYRKLKSEFFDRLYNVSLFIDPKNQEFSDVQKAYYSSYRLWATIQVLLARRATKAAMDLCTQVLKDAIKYEITDIVVAVSKHLKNAHATHTGDKKLYEECKKIYHEWRDIQEAEHIAEECHNELVIHYVRNKATKPEISKKANDYLKLLRPYLDQYHSNYLQQLGRVLEVIKFMSIGDYQTTLKICDDSIAYFEAKPVQYKFIIDTFLHQKAICHKMFFQLSESENALKKSNGIFSEGSSNWFRNQELTFTIYLYGEKYDEAYDLFKKVTTHKQFEFLFENKHEEWKIYEAYLQFLINAGAINQVGAKRKPFKITKFLNEVPIFIQDKRGLNVPILIIQILHLIQSKQYEDIIDRIEALQKYLVRYTNKTDETFRSDCFIRLLVEMAKAGFARQEVENRTKVLLKELQEAPMLDVNQTYNLEVIPLERVWGYMMAALPQRAYYQ